jgi:hypothetical protein
MDAPEAARILRVQHQGIGHAYRRAEPGRPV